MLHIYNTVFEIIGVFCLRELKLMYRSYAMVIGNIFSIILWLVIFGMGLGGSLTISGNVSYQSFLFAGIIAQGLLNTSIMGGVSIINDKQFGMFKSILVSPVSRTIIGLSKALAITIVAIVDTAVLLLLSFIVGVSISLIIFILVLFVSFIISLGFSCLGISIAYLIENIQGFGAINSFLITPLFLLSGSLFPIEGQLPVWLKGIIYLDPLTYGVDLLRLLIINTNNINWIVDLCVIIGFLILMLMFCTYIFNKREEYIF